MRLRSFLLSTALSLLASATCDAATVKVQVPAVQPKVATVKPTVVVKPTVIVRPTVTNRSTVFRNNGSGANPPSRVGGLGGNPGTTTGGASLPSRVSGLGGNPGPGATTGNPSSGTTTGGSNLPSRVSGLGGSGAGTTTNNNQTTVGVPQGGSGDRKDGRIDQ